MLSRRIISCLDVRDGHLAKSVKFVNTKNIGDPIEKARAYYEDGLDELVFYDITASSEKRDIMIDVVEEVASQIFIPFSVGGGIRSAAKRPELIREISDAIGAQSTVLSMDVLAVPVTAVIPSGYEIVINGGRKAMGMDAIEWAKQSEQLGAGELVVNSIDADGTREGYELKLTRVVADSVRIPIIASGGAGKPEHLYDVLTDGGADAALIASMLHYGEYTVSGLKQYLAGRGIAMRMGH